jgi:hypothetical protein
MSKTHSGTGRLSSTTLPFTAPPYSWMIWCTSVGGQARKFMSVGKTTDATAVLAIDTDITSGATNKVSSLVSSPANNGQTLSLVAINTAGQWNCCQAVEATTGNHASYLNGGNKGTSGAVIATPTGLNLFVISGRPTDFSSGIGGQSAHAAIWSGRVLSDTEVAYLGAGGNPRAIKGLTNYWKIGSAENPVLDQVGTLDLTVTGTSAGTTDPDIQTFMTGGPVGTLSWTAGTTIAPINLAAGAIFDDVSSPFSVTLCQLAAPTNPTTVSSALTAAREVPVVSATGITAGSYIKITSGGTPTRVLWVNGLTVLVDKDQTCASGAQVFLHAVNTLTIPGMNMSANVYSGIPSSAATYTLTFFRATCSANTTLRGDTELETITVASSGGGGGGGVTFAPCGNFSGGFCGG